MLKNCKKYIVIVCICVSTVIAFGCGEQTDKVSLEEAEKEEVLPEKKEDEIPKKNKENKEEKEEEKSLKEEPKEEISVYVCGCVKNPGVYILQLGSRVKDAIEKAGGMTDEAHDSCLNLALKVKDEEVIRVPNFEDGEIQLGLKKEENEMCEAMAMAGMNPVGVDINEASKDVLMTLPGIGESKADAIIAYREENGLFSSKEELKNVKGIGDGVFKKLEDKITVK